MEIYGGCIMVSNNKKMQEVTNFLQQHQHDADVNTAFSEAKELIASEMLNAKKRSFSLIFQSQKCAKSGLLLAI